MTKTKLKIKTVVLFFSIILANKIQSELVYIATSTKKHY